MNGTPSEHPTELLAAYLDDELSIEERGRLDHHLADCASCRRELEALHLLSAAVAAEPVPEPEAGLAERIGTYVDRETVARMPVRRRWFVPVSVAATIGAVGLLVALQWREGTFSPRVPPPLASPPSEPVPSEKRPEPSAEERGALGDVSGGAREAEPKLEEQEKKNIEATPPPAPAAPPPAAQDELARAKVKDSESAQRDLDRKEAASQSSFAPDAALSATPAQGASQDAAADKEALGRLYQKTIYLPPARADAAACGDSWVDSARPAAWAVADLAAAAKDLEAIARSLHGRGSERQGTDGVTYEIDVPTGRYDELSVRLREKGVAGLDEPFVPLEGAPCVRQRIRLSVAGPGEPRP